ncbi:DUF917 domain-containing protein [Microbacterium marinilacus]|uniref:DUF917 domain-containing protein n=1 Tax=Microbacterium marinilacus TaxID=415209 RepID=A0ABP7BBK8_9MICO|nr:DUF917 domain-containing protein [Microbacterium marinilacus]MBY0687093.1 DUF917 domain-containing protein [Microbacterium marinilacus]
MARRVERADVAALARGCALLGSGGGGVTTHLELIARSASWPVDLVCVDDLDPATPCIAAAFAGSTMVLTERLPGIEPFAPLVAAVERWLGREVPALCSFEIGGLNGLTGPVAAGGRVLVDADCMGRALPRIDQVSLVVDGVPGLVFAVTTGAGVTLIESARPTDVESLVRAALQQAGGTGAVVVGGFTVGDLRQHAMPGMLSRALDLGRAFLGARELPVPEFAEALGGRLLAVGRIRDALTGPVDPQVQSFEISGADGAVHRLVTRTETLALVTDGALVSSSPDVLAVVDARTRAILEVPQLKLGQHVAVVELPVSGWWRASRERMRRVVPSFYGIEALDPAW